MEEHLHNLDIILFLVLQSIWVDTRKINLKFQGLITFSRWLWDLGFDAAGPGSICIDPNLRTLALPLPALPQLPTAGNQSPQVTDSINRRPTYCPPHSHHHTLHLSLECSFLLLLIFIGIDYVSHSFCVPEPWMSETKVIKQQKGKPIHFKDISEIQLLNLRKLLKMKSDTSSTF